MCPHSERARMNVNIKENDQLWQGMKHGLPILLGYVPLGLAFGVIAANSGLVPWQIALMSLLVFSGSGQYIAVGMLAVGAPVVAILITTGLINLRYLLLCASLAPRLQGISAKIVAFLAHGITDEVYAVAMNYFRDRQGSASYLFGVALVSHASWVLSSFIGGSVGNLLGNIEAYGINFALTAMFISLLIMQIGDRISLYVAVCGAVLAVVIYAAFGTKLNILIAAIIAATLGVLFKQWAQKY